MRKSMKCLSILGLLAGLLAAVTVSASAAENTNGIYDLTARAGYAIQVQKADSTVLLPVNLSVEGRDVQIYLDAEKLGISYSGAETGQFHLILLLEGDTPIPTADNMAYIDQVTAEGSEISFAVFPKEMKNGTYKLYKAVSDGSGLVEVASFKYYSQGHNYTLGDVNGDGQIKANDAQLALQIAGGQNMDKWTEAQKLAADVDGVAGIKARDAQYILEKAAGLPGHF